MGRVSNRRKPAIEFREHRMYVPGDDIRFVDWQASARQDQIFIRQGEMPKDVIVYLLLDTSASMLWGKTPKRNAQLSLAAALGYAALQNGDRLYVHAYGENNNPDFGPASGKGHLSSLCPLSGTTEVWRSVRSGRRHSDPGTKGHPRRRGLHPLRPAGTW